MLKRIYEELVAIRKELQTIRSSMEHHGCKNNSWEFSQAVQSAKNCKEESVCKITLYANNEMYCQEICVFLSHHDWCELQKKSFYQELMQYLDNLEIQKSANSPDEQKDLMGMQEFL